MQRFEGPKGDPPRKEIERQRLLTRNLIFAIVFLVGAILIVGIKRLAAA